MGIKDALEAKHGEPKDDPARNSDTSDKSEPAYSTGARNQKYQKSWQKYFKNAGCDGAEQLSYAADLLVISSSGLASRTLPRNRFLAYSKGMNPNYGLVMESMGLPEEVELNDLGYYQADIDLAGRNIQKLLTGSPSTFYLSTPHMLARWMSDEGSEAYLSLCDRLKSYSDFSLKIKLIRLAPEIFIEGWNDFRRFENNVIAPSSLKLVNDPRKMARMLKDFRFVTGHIRAIKGDSKNCEGAEFLRRIDEFYEMEI